MVIGNEVTTEGGPADPDRVAGDACELCSFGALTVGPGWLLALLPL